jgi:hypothetical protein
MLPTGLLEQKDNYYLLIILLIPSCFFSFGNIIGKILILLMNFNAANAPICPSPLQTRATLPPATISRAGIDQFSPPFLPATERVCPKTGLSLHFKALAWMIHSASLIPSPSRTLVPPHSSA